jgi:hypothetical protein
MKKSGDFSLARNQQLRLFMLIFLWFSLNQHRFNASYSYLPLLHALSDGENEIGGFFLSFMEVSE